MNFVTFKFIIYALIFIIFAHFIINYLLKKNNNDSIEKKKKIVHKLSDSEEADESTIIKENFSNNKDSKSKNENLNDMDTMKDDILSFLENNNDLYNNESNNDSPIDKNMNQELKLSHNYEKSDFSGISNSSLDSFFENNNLEGSIEYKDTNKNKKKSVIINPQIDLQTKEKIYVDDNTFDKSSCIKPDIWKYQDENIMNGGQMEGGLTAWDNLDSGLAMYNN